MVPAVIPVPERLMQEDHKFEVNLCYMVSSRSFCTTYGDCLKANKQKDYIDFRIKLKAIIVLEGFY